MRLRPFVLERYLAAHEFRAAHVLCASDCETVTIGELLALEPGAADRFHALRLGYTETAGGPELRREIATLYERVSPEHVLVHAGAQEAIFGFMSACLAPSDHVLVHSPAYASLHEVARAVGCEVERWAADEAAGWALDVAGLERRLRPDTRAIVLNLPHNPTGWLMDRGAFEGLLALADARGIVVFCDEVYRGLEYRPAERLPAACDASERAVSLGVLSKTYGLPGLRIGWVATRNRAVLEAMAAFKDYTSICASAPSEFLAALALRHRHRLVRRNLRIIQANLQRFTRFVQAREELFAWTPPRAGSVTFPALRKGGAERFCAELLERTGVLLAPGTCFDHGDRHVRVGLGRRDFPAALARLDAFVGGVGSG